MMTHTDSQHCHPERSEGRAFRAARLLLIGIAALSLAACRRVVGPNYARPDVKAPSVYRGADAAAQPPASTASVADKPWPEVFHDPQLRQLIRTAIAQNYDVRIAANRIVQAETQLGVVRAAHLPTIDLGAGADYQRFAAQRFSTFQTDQYNVNLGFRWELDFWGRYARATEEAKATILAGEWARQAVISTLVADVASAYFRLRALDLELEISRRTLESRRESLELTRTLTDNGLGTMLDVRQAEQLVYTAAARIPDIERQIEQEENFISMLIGNNPESITRGLAIGEQLGDQQSTAAVPSGLPSDLLERRSDIRAAEQRLVALNARIGLAQTALFPRIALTGVGGFQSTALNDLLNGTSFFFSLGAGLTQTIFNRDRLRADVELAEARQQEALLTYQKTIQQAFREVSDALVAYRKNQEFRAQQELLTESAREASALADQRFRAGVTSYLEVLTNQSNLFTAELALARARSGELEAQVQIYRALGGGWNE